MIKTTIAVVFAGVLIAGCTDAQLAQAERAIAVARSAAPSATAPTAAPSPSASPVDQVQQPLSFSGTGRTGLSKAFQLTAGPRRFVATHTGKGNFIVRLNDSKGETVTGLFNEIGPHDGAFSHFLKASGTYYLDVAAAGGDWSIKIE